MVVVAHHLHPSLFFHSGRHGQWAYNKLASALITWQYYATADQMVWYAMLLSQITPTGRNKSSR